MRPIFSRSSVAESSKYLEYSCGSARSSQLKLWHICARSSQVIPARALTIRFAIWDTGDSALDSTVLVDDFKWLATTGTTVEVGTKPVPK